METTNSTYMPESTTSQLLVYDPTKAFFTMEQIINTLPFNMQEVYLGNNVIFGERRRGKYILNFNTVFKYLVTEENGYVFIKNSKLNIDYIIEDFSEIIPSLMDELIYLWNTYVLVDDNCLASDAIDFKQAILEIYSISIG